MPISNRENQMLAAFDKAAKKMTAQKAVVAVAVSFMSSWLTLNRLLREARPEIFEKEESGNAGTKPATMKTKSNSPRKKPVKHVIHAHTKTKKPKPPLKQTPKPKAIVKPVPKPMPELAEERPDDVVVQMPRRNASPNTPAAKSGIRQLRTAKR